MDLLAPLKRYFGFASFRPLQQQIVEDVLAGRDVFALLPTGGGKSLCYQLPAVLRPGLTLVVSPLIALMKDQVDALQAMGISATYLNSSVPTPESARRFRLLNAGGCQLLYVAPERLLMDSFLPTARQWPVRLIAIDEAHCISEWGHDFRPEYRQLSRLRDEFASIPLLALTATATDRVRRDVIEQLRLREPAFYTGSFNRPNLKYQVAAKKNGYSQLVRFLMTRPGQSGIIYCQSRQGAERLAQRLSAEGIRAAPYHAGLPGADRDRHQEAFLRDEVPVICATIAFGMGVNKPNVRFVVHYDLPKNLEGYYQETGRAGRDGLPSDCLLLFNPGDVVKQTAFIEEKSSPQEQRLAREQLQQMVHFAETSRCRRAVLLEYFGEAWSADSCGACDNCLFPRSTFDGTVAAQKFLSCVYRIGQKQRFSVGLNHIVEVLTGADTEKIRRWGHQELSTYGIGSEYDRSEWQAIGRELVRLGYLKQSSEKFAVLELTPDGLNALRQRKPFTLTEPPRQKKAPALHDQATAYDETLFDRLRVLRRELAALAGVPPYIVFSDVSLRQMARRYPVTEPEFAGITGVGEKKRTAYGGRFVAEIANYLQANPRQLFAGESF